MLNLIPSSMVIAQNSLFAPAVNYNVGSSPRSIFAFDLEGDGDKDLATANTNSNNVSILRNNGDGTFQWVLNLSVGSTPMSIFASNIDGDEDIDLIVANYWSNNISILRNNGDGTFQVAVNYSVGTNPNSVFAVDLDGDGDTDVAVANYESNNISFLRNNGNGTFQAAINYAAGSRPSSIIASDLDGDGDNDLAVANNGGPNVFIFRNNGDGTFQFAGNYGVWSSPHSVYAADLDGDGNNDLAVANMAYNYDIVSILINNGNGTFQSAVNYRVGDYPNSVFASDLDNDGDMDIVTANEDNNNVSVLRNNGSGTFQAMVNYGVGDWPYSVFAADLDGDGDMDLAVTNSNSNNVSILINQTPPPPTFCTGFSGLFCDDFEDGAGPAWQQTEGSCTWQTSGGEFQTSLSGPTQSCVQSVGNLSWQNYTFEVDIRGNQGCDKIVRFRQEDSGTRYFVNLRSDWQEQDELILGKQMDGQETILRTISYPSDNGIWYSFRIEAVNSHISVSVNGVEQIAFDDIENVIFDGGIGLVAFTGGTGICDISFDNVRVTESETHQATLEGHVRTAHVPPQPIEGATVEIRQSGYFLTSTTTNAEGYYALNLPVGTYGVTVSEPNYEIANSGISVPQQGVTYDIELLLSEYANLDLTVGFTQTMFIDNSADAETDRFTISGEFHNAENRPFSIVTVAFNVDGEFEHIQTFSLDANETKNESYGFSIPTPWNDKTVRTAIKYVNGWKATFSHSVDISTPVSVAYLSNGAPFRLNPDAYQFSNPYGWPLIKKYFETTSPTLGRYLVLMPALFASFNGVCFGMAGSSSAYFLDPSEKPVNIPTHSMTIEMSGVADRLVQYHLSQILQNEDIMDLQVPSEMGNNIKNALTQQKNVVISLFDSDLCNGHAVSAYKSIVNHAQDVEYVTIYDNESIWSATPQVMQIGLEGQGFMTYALDDPRWEHARAFENVGRYTDNQILKFAWNFIKRMPRNLECLVSGVLPKKLQIMCPVRPLITASNGERLGFINDSTWVNDIISANYSIWQSGSSDSSYYFELPMELSYNVSFSSIRAGNVDIIYFAPATDSSGVFSIFDSLSFTEGTSGSFQIGPGIAAIDSLSIDYNGDQIPDSTIFPIRSAPLGPFDLISPITGQSIYHSVWYTWHPAININWEDTIRYKVYLSTDSTFSSYDSSLATTDTCLTWSSLLIDSTYYYWKVLAVDNYGESTSSYQSGSFFYRYATNVIQGNVLDRSSMPIDSVDVYTAGPEMRNTLSGLDGSFKFDSLRAGSYSITFSHQNYQDTTVFGVTVISADTVNVTVNLGSLCSYLSGDINGNGQANGIDVVYGVNYLKGGAALPYSCECPPGNTWFVAGDVNGNCAFNGIDITYFVNYLKGGPPLLSCPDCPPARLAEPLGPGK